MIKKLISCMMTVTMVASVFCLPAAAHGAAAQTVPKVGKTVGVKTKATSCRTIKVTWKKVSGATGYELYRYSKKKKRYGLVTGTKKTSYSNKKLKANTTYRFKVRAYTMKDGKKYYGAFSKTVKRKTQKTDGQKVVAKAKTKLDASYRSGGSGPNGFDCSGFVYWVYKNAKVDEKKRVPRTSSAGLYSSLKKYKVGSSLKSIKKAEPGDIILFKRGGRYSHAAIYAGKGKIVHAANPRRDVCVQSVKQLHNSGTRVATVVRIVD